MTVFRKATLTAGLLLATGCVSQDSRFFTCNRWVDRNMNQRIEPNEFEGRGTFMYRSSEDVTFVAHIVQPPGTRIGWQLRAPDGTIRGEGEGIQREQDTVYRKSYSARELIRTGGSGLWQVDWFVNGVLVGSSRAHIVR